MSEKANTRDMKDTTIVDFLRDFRLKYTREDADSGLSLLDRLTPDGDESVTRGMEEIDLLVEDLICDYIEPLRNHIIELESKRQDDKSQLSSRDSEEFLKMGVVDALCNLAYRAIQFENGEMVGYDIIAFEELCPILLSPITSERDEAVKLLERASHRVYYSPDLSKEIEAFLSKTPKP